ncbi:MAG TPA: hypothetical protein VG722_12860 [Tepidisphaeraceae bacterium]|nr:hypothetical protein [Tepidisphaeraceae bacterium]
MSLCLHAWAIHALVGEEEAAGPLSWGGWEVQKEKPKKQKPIELVKLPPPEESEDQFGQSQGRGKAINSMIGDQPLRAKQAPQEQAMLNRHPGEQQRPLPVTPQMAKVNPAKASSANSGGKGGTAEKLLVALSPSEKNPMALVGVSPAEPAQSPINQPARKPEIPAGSGPEKATTAKQPAMPKPMLASDGPGQQSESESDAFSVVGSAVYHEGEVEARFGRKVRTVRPYLSFAAQMELMNLVDPSIQFVIHADATGKPTDVEVIRSSCSNLVNQPVKLAMYDWWFEPPKNRQGKPMPDVMVWTISFR